jgi:putative membrane protein
MKHPDKETYDAAMNRLKGLKGTEFDVAFIAKEIAHHQRMIDAVDNKFLPAAKNAELKQLLTELKPSLQSHLDQARALEKKLALGN